MFMYMYIYIFIYLCMDTYIYYINVVPKYITGNECCHRTGANTQSIRRRYFLESSAHMHASLFRR